MARAAISGFDDVDKMFEKLMKPKETAMKAVDSAAPELKKAVQSAIKSVDVGYGTGRLAASFEATKAKENQYGVYSVVRPVGGRDGIDYRTRASWVEFGRFRKGNKKGSNSQIQPARPFRQKAINDAKNKCEDMMEKTINEFIEDATR